MPKKIKSPIYRNGELLCPHCKAPLLVEEDIQGKFYCSICKAEISKLAKKTLMDMVDDFPAELLQEWILEK